MGRDIRVELTQTGANSSVKLAKSERTGDFRTGVSSRRTNTEYQQFDQQFPKHTEDAPFWNDRPSHTTKLDHLDGHGEMLRGYPLIKNKDMEDHIGNMAGVHTSSADMTPIRPSPRRLGPAGQRPNDIFPSWGVAGRESHKVTDSLNQNAKISLHQPDTNSAEAQD